MVALFPSDSLASKDEHVFSKTIHGTVIDSVNKNILHGASIHIWNTVSRAKVEANGEFIIDIPEYLQSDVLIMEIKFPKFDSKILSFKVTGLSDFLTIGLEPKGKQVKSAGRPRWKLFG